MSTDPAKKKKKEKGLKKKREPRGTSRLHSPAPPSLRSCYRRVHVLVRACLMFDKCVLVSVSAV